MKSDNEILESIVVGGLIGAALGALISNSKTGTGIGAIAGAVLLASFTANQNAKNANIPIVVEENNELYEIRPDGSKRFIKSIPKINRSIPKQFILD